MAAIADTVRPGDVISSDLLNRIISLLNAHDALLSGGSTSGANALTITGFTPNPPFQAGQDLQIVGTNFGFSSGATTLKFDSTQVNAFKLGSSDSSLLVNVPFLTSLGSGKDVLLSLSNGTTTAARVVHVLPMQQPQQGNVDVLINDAVVPNPNPNPITNGGAATIAYVVRSRALLQGTFVIAVQCSNAAMQAAAQVLDAAQNPMAAPEFVLAPNQQQAFFVRFPNVTVANGSTLSLTVSASTPGVAGSDTRSYTVGTAVAPPDTTIGLAFNAFTASDPNTGNPDPTASFSAGDNTVHLHAPSIGRVNLFATFTQAGTYNVTLQTLAPTANWSVVLADTPTQYVVNAAALAAGGGTVTQNPQIGMQQQAGASATGQAKLTLQRQGSTLVREFVINLATIP